MSTSPTTGGTDEPQGLTPPYEKDDPGQVQENPVSKSSGKTGPVSEGRIVSDEEQDGVGDTDIRPDAALGVGESINTRAEDQGGQDTGEEGRRGPSGRPTGTHGDETSGVSDSSDDDRMGQSGDQGG